MSRCLNVDVGPLSGSFLSSVNTDFVEGITETLLYDRHTISPRIWYLTQRFIYQTFGLEMSRTSVTKRLVLPVVLALACTSCTERSPEPITRLDLSEDLYVRQVQEGAFVITHSFPWPANALLVEMANTELLLIDTPYTPEATKELLAWAGSYFGRRGVTVINTGYHHDNLGGNDYLVSQGIPVYGSVSSVQLLDAYGEDIREKTLADLQAPQYSRFRTVHTSLPYVAPTHLFELMKGKTLAFGEESVQIFYPGPSHAPDNVVVYIPSRKILFGGCMVIGWEGMGNTSDADVEAWPVSVRELFRFEPEIVVPGHGARLDPGLLEHTVDRLESFLDTVIEPGERVGSINKNTNRPALQRIYGAGNVFSADVYLGEGFYERGTAVLPEDSARALQIIFRDSTQTNPARIDIKGTAWHTSSGIGLGTELKELEVLNGGPFTLAGFEWDYEGTVTSWDGGTLETDFHQGGRIILRLRPDDDIVDPSLMGDHAISSQHSTIQRLNPKVYEMIVLFE